MNQYDRIYNILLELSDKQLEMERGEFKRVAHEDRRGVKKQRGSKTQKLASTEREMAAARKGKEVTVKNLKGVTDTDAPDIKPGVAGLRKTVRILKGYGRDRTMRRRVFDQVRGHDKQGNKKSADASIVRVDKGGNESLKAGNSRAMMAAAQGKKVRVHKYKAPK
tara:strand:- start:37 stop:531 length:495 start_codon:yes stop_codon:yes gene_type:complete